jgi:hypothetical protein
MVASHDKTPRPTRSASTRSSGLRFELHCHGLVVGFTLPGQ